MADLITDVRKFIKEKREKKGWSQERLAQESFGSKAERDYINKIENGQKTPKLERLGKILNALSSKINFEEY